MKRLLICLLMVFWATSSPAQGKNAMDYFNLGLKHSGTRKKIKYFTKALELDPSLAAAHEKRGLLYYYQEDYNNVIQDYIDYIRFVPDDVEAYRMLGIGYLKSGRYEPAIHTFNRAVEIEPEMASAYANRAEAYRLMGKDEEAIRDATKAAQLASDPITKADAYKTRGKVYRKLGYVKLAVADSRAAMRIDPRVPRFWGRRYAFKYASPEELSRAGLLALIVIACILVFKFRLKPPEK